MKTDRQRYLQNVKPFYKMEPNRQQPSFWYNVGSSIPYFSMGYVIGYIIGLFLVARYIIWPVLSAILEGIK